jgi:hypothetical protein
MESIAKSFGLPFPFSTTSERVNGETAVATETKKDRPVSEKALRDLDKWRSEYKLELESRF